jgi:hypothetical protein
MEITKKQIQQIQTIMSSRFSDRDERLDFVTAQTGREITSTKLLTFIEAEDLIYFLNTGKTNKSNWGFFDDDKFVSERKLLFSYMYQAQWTVPHETRTEVPDLERLSNFLKSPKNPTKKPLKKFDKKDWSKILQVFNNIVKGTYK